MYTCKYKLKKDLSGRAAITLSWSIEELPFYTQIIIDEGRTINASSLVGLLSAGLRESQIITFAVREQPQRYKLQQKIKDLDFLQEVEQENEHISQ